MSRIIKEGNILKGWRGFFSSPGRVLLETCADNAQVRPWSFNAVGNIMLPELGRYGSFCNCVQFPIPPHGSRYIVTFDDEEMWTFVNEDKLIHFPNPY